jgi:hypothetical protein
MGTDVLWRMLLHSSFHAGIKSVPREAYMIQLRPIKNTVIFFVKLIKQTLATEGQNILNPA